MKKKIITLAAFMALTCEIASAGTWKCIDNSGRSYTVSQDVPSDRCIKIRSANPYGVKNDSLWEATARSRGVLIGMSKDEVLKSSWGRPKHVNRTVTRYGTREQWVYHGSNYLYFEDDVLTAIQN